MDGKLAAACAAEEFVGDRHRKQQRTNVLSTLIRSNRTAAKVIKTSRQYSTRIYQKKARLESSSLLTAQLRAGRHLTRQTRPGNFCAATVDVKIEKIRQGFERFSAARCFSGYEPATVADDLYTSPLVYTYSCYYNLLLAGASPLTE